MRGVAGFLLQRKTWAGENAGRLFRSAPAIISFLLLAFQICIPWTVPYFVTQDGASHLYSAAVARDLVLHPKSEYSRFYRFDRHVQSNWGAPVLMAASLSLAGPRNAEKLFVSLSVLIGFAAFWYASECLLPGFGAVNPIFNFLLQNWFLWIGFHNFYLGMVILPCVLGYYIKHRDKLFVVPGIVLATGMVVLFLIHVIPAAVALMTVFVVCVWVNVIAPFLPTKHTLRDRNAIRNAWRRTLVLSLACLPAISLMLMFALNQPPPEKFESSVAAAWKAFPAHIFTTGAAGDQSILWPGILFCIVISILSMNAEEWRGPKGGIAIALVLVLGLYLIVPDSGFGGALAKFRFSLGFFVLGGLLLCTSRALARFLLPASIYVGCFAASSLFASLHFVGVTSPAVADYLAAIEGIPPGARIVRIQYPIPAALSRYTLAGTGRNPFFHLDAFAATKKHLVDLSDYGACNGIFPLTFETSIDIGQRMGLWGMEGADRDAVKVLEWLRPSLEIQYVLVTGEEGSAGAVDHGIREMLTYLASHGQLVGTSKSGPFVRVFKLNPSDPRPL